MANPKGDVPSNLGFLKEKDQEIKAQGSKWAFPSQITAKRDSQNEDIPLKRAPVCETRQMKLKCAYSG